MLFLRLLATTVVLFLPVAVSAQSKATQELPKLTKVELVSSLDKELQPVLYWAPEKARQESTPLFVFLHSWSGDYRQDNSKWHAQAVKRGWIYVHPNFRGVNQTPKACGSKWARQDILDAVDFATKEFKVDPKRIYLAGTSGGGHMAMLMAGHHPDRFSAVSAWVGISDLPAWYEFHVKDGKPQRYARMLLSSFGGAPGDSDTIDADYKDRSPIHHMHRAVNLPLQICAGINDGCTGSVPISHSLYAFNAVARAGKATVISDADIAHLLNRKKVSNAASTSNSDWKAYGRDIRFEHSAGLARVVIFDGGHEGLPRPACDWLASQSRTVLIRR
jgi:dipeptidyl aminopeptidase/acylaminoacyl peptidase